MKVSLRIVKSHLEEVRESMVTRSHYSSKFQLHYHSRTINWPYKRISQTREKVTENRNAYLHLFYANQRAAEEKTKFNQLLDSLERELLEGSRDPRHEKVYEKYFTVKNTPTQGTKVIPNEEVLAEVEKGYGHFSLRSNGVRDPLEALDMYRSKDVVEKAFGNLKERLDMRRTSVSLDENPDGKLFVQYTALILLCYITKVMNENNLFKRYPLQEMLDELDVVERYEYPTRKHLTGEVTKKQKELFEIFGVHM